MNPDRKLTLGHLYSLRSPSVAESVMREHYRRRRNQERVAAFIWGFGFGLVLATAWFIAAAHINATRI